MAGKRKTDFKGVMKKQVKEKLKEFFKDYEITDLEKVCWEGYTKDTIIVRNIEVEGAPEPIDVQIKLIAPSVKNGNHYPSEEEGE